MIQDVCSTALSMLTEVEMETKQFMLQSPTVLCCVLSVRVVHPKDTDCDTGFNCKMSVSRSDLKAEERAYNRAMANEYADPEMAFAGRAKYNAFEPFGNGYGMNTYDRVT